MVDAAVVVAALYAKRAGAIKRPQLHVQWQYLLRAHRRVQEGRRQGETLFLNGSEHVVPSTQ